MKLRRLMFGLCAAVALFMLGPRVDATAAPAKKVNWHCDYLSNLFEFCNQFDVHNSEYLGGGGLTLAYGDTECQDALVGSESWLTGATDLTGPGGDGWDYETSIGYVESSSSSEHPSDSSFFGVYQLHSFHWYDGDPFTCGQGDLSDPGFYLEWEIT